MKQGHNESIRRVLFVFIIITIAIIWGHSMVPRPVSAAESGQFVLLFEPLWRFFSLGEDMADHIIRKCAHFTEYGILGGELCAFHSLGRKMMQYKQDKPDQPFAVSEDKRQNLKVIHRAAGQALLVALTDETIQFFSARGSQVTDVWLDFAGACAGAVIVLALIKRTASADR